MWRSTRWSVEMRYLPHNEVVIAVEGIGVQIAVNMGK
jgi:hypothetical protein